MKSSPSPHFQETPANFRFWLGILLCSFLGLGGFYFGSRRPAVAASPATEQGPLAKPEAPRSLVELARQLAALPAGLERQRRLLAMLDQARVEDFPGLMLEFSGDLQMLSAMAEAWSEKDPAGCLAWLTKQPTHGQNYFIRAAQQALRKWAIRDPEAALAAARQSLHLPEMGHMEWEVFVSAYRVDSARGIAILSKLSGDAPLGFSLPKDLWKIGAGDVIQKLAQNRGKIERWLALGLADAMREWSAAEPEKVLEWMKKSPPEQWGKLLQYAMASLGAKDPLAAAALLEKVPLWKDRQKAGKQLAIAWADKDPASALDFATRQLGPDARDTVSDLAVPLLEKGRGMELEQAMARLPQGAARDLAMQEVGMHYLDHDPRQATQWLTMLPPDETRHRLLPKLAVRWSETNAQGAADFFRKNPNQPALQEARDKFVKAWAPQEPLQALEMGKNLEPEARSLELRSVVSSVIHEGQFDSLMEIMPTLLPAERELAISTTLTGFRVGIFEPQQLSEWVRLDASIRPRIEEFLKNTPTLDPELAKTALIYIKQDAGELSDEEMEKLTGEITR